MFHFSTRNALLPSAAMTILLGLSACGGGGGSDPAPVDASINASGAAAAAGQITVTPPPATTPPPAAPPPAAGPLSLTGLTDFRSTAPNTLVNFAAATPNTVVTQAITGLNAGDIVVGIDVRPFNGTMYAFARADVGGAPTGAASIYAINPATGAASGRVAVTGVVFDGATSVSVDFNPVVDRMRVITFFGQSVAINVADGAATASPAVTGGSGFTAAIAYTNSAASTTAPAATVLYRIDNLGAPDDLTTITPATGAIATTVGPIGRDLNEVQAFDITGANNVNALAALRTTATGPHSLYRINLSLGTATLIGTPADSTIGTVPLVDIAIRP